MLNRLCLSGLLLSSICFSALARQYCELFDNPRIEQVELSYSIAAAETNQLSEIIDPKPLAILKHVRFRPSKDGMSVCSWYSGTGESAAAAKFLRNAPDNYGIGVLGTELPGKNALPEKMMTLLGRLIAGEWWPPLPANHNEKKMTARFMMLAYPVEDQSVRATYEASYMIENIGTVRINGVQCSRYQYSIIAPYERFSDKKDQILDNPKKALRRTQQKLLINGEFAINEATGVVHSRTEELEFLMNDARRTEVNAPWRITQGGGEQKMRIRIRLKSLKTVYDND